MASMQLSNGDLNKQMIEKELVSAIAEDHNFRVTDDAKKRHIATAASYDEFRNFVACADQKRVSRSEMQSLSQPEKGWKTRSNLVTGAVGKNSDRRAAKGKKTKNSISSEFPAEPPKTPVAFERDWRRHCKTRELRLRYLEMCSSAVIQKVFKVEVDVALLTQIIATFAETAQIIGPLDVPDSTALLILDVLRVLPTTGRFSLNIQFMSDDDKLNVRYCLEWIEAMTQGPAVSGFTAVDEVARLKRDYQLN